MSKASIAVAVAAVLSVVAAVIIAASPAQAKKPATVYPYHAEVGEVHCIEGVKWLRYNGRIQPIPRDGGYSGAQRCEE